VGINTNLAKFPYFLPFLKEEHYIVVGVEMV